METSTNPTALDTLTTTDQNTGRRTTWSVVSAIESGPNTRRASGFTHHLVCTRPRGRKAHVIHVELIGNVVVRHSTPVVAW